MHTSSTTHEHHPRLLHHFDDLEQQKEAVSLGMWVFLITEIMFFGGLFLGYLVYRLMYFPAFAAASSTLDIKWGAINTAVLIFSSLTMAMAVHAAQLGRRKATALFLLATIALGLVFLGVKAIEYSDKFEHHHVPGRNFVFHQEAGHGASGHEQPQAVDPNHAQIFFSFYFAMTGMHALHMVIGVGILAVVTFFAWRGAYTPEYHATVENVGLYWHFVDIVWIFLFPLLYLISRHQ